MLMSGTVRTLNGMKKYGFITTKANGDFFFHKEDFLGYWDDLENDFNASKVINVEFKMGETEKGPRAREVRRTEFPNEG